MNRLLRLLLVALLVGWGLGVAGTTAGSILHPFGITALGVLVLGAGVSIILWRRARP